MKHSQLCSSILIALKTLTIQWDIRLGDQLLILVEERLRHCVRKGDVVARLGGDEYVILLPSAPTNVTEAVAS